MNRFTTILLVSILAWAHSGMAEWIHNDWNRAIKIAKKEKKRIFADFWAEWCYSCHLMDETVLPELTADETLKDYVLLKINTENSTNRSLLSSVSINFWPTFIIFNANGKELKRIEGENTVHTMRIFTQGQLPSDHTYKKVQARLKNQDNTVDTCISTYTKTRPTLKRYMGCQPLYIAYYTLSCIERTQSPETKRDLSPSVKNALAIIDTDVAQFNSAHVLTDTPTCIDYATAFHVPIMIAEQTGQQDTRQTRLNHAIDFFMAKSKYTGTSNSTTRPASRSHMHSLYRFLWTATDQGGKNTDQLHAMLTYAATVYPDDFYFAHALGKFYLQKASNFSDAEKWLKIALTRAKGDTRYLVQATRVKLMLAQNKKKQAATLLATLLAEPHLTETARNRLLKVQGSLEK